MALIPWGSHSVQNGRASKLAIGWLWSWSTPLRSTLDFFLFPQDDSENFIPPLPRNKLMIPVQCLSWDGFLVSLCRNLSTFLSAQSTMLRVEDILAFVVLRNLLPAIRCKRNESLH